MAQLIEFKMPWSGCPNESVFSDRQKI